MGFEHVLVAGGGSGGHVFPALAVAEELESRGWRVSWLGRTEGMERDLVERRGIAYHGIEAAAVIGRSLPARGVALAKVGASAWKASRLIRRERIAAVLAAGGYVSAPGALGGVLVRRPVVLIEPNAVPGAANRWLSRFAVAAAVGMGFDASRLRCPVEETGVPIRAVFGGERPRFDETGPLEILVLGGSQGARQLNELLPVVFSGLTPPADGIHITHQVGSRWIDETRKLYSRNPSTGIEVTLVPFLEDVHRAMARSHLVVSRAGAITLAEICAVGRAALLLPLGLAGSHQVANSRHLVEAGGAVSLGPPEVSIGRLRQELETLISDRPRLREMGDALFEQHRPGAASSVADLVEGAARA